MLNIRETPFTGYAQQHLLPADRDFLEIWMTGMIFMIHRKPGFLNVKFVDKDFLCLKFSIANGIFRVNGKDWFLDFQIHHLRRPQSLLR